MAATGLDVFDKTLQTTHIWLDEIMSETGAERHLAWRALGAVLRTIRDRLPADLSAHLSAQLPLLVRGAYYDQWRPAGQPERYRSLDEFLGRIGMDMQRNRPVDLEDLAQAVFRVIARHLDPGVVGKVVDALPEEVRALWRRSAAVGGATAGSDAAQGEMR